MDQVICCRHGGVLDNLVCQVSNKEDKEKLVAQLLAGDNYYFAFLSGYLGSGPWARLVNIQLAKKVPFSQELVLTEDTAWNIQLVYKAKKINVIGSVWYSYFDNKESVTKQFRKNRQQEILIEISTYQALSLSLFPKNDNDFYMRYWYILAAYYKQFLFHKNNKMSLREKYLSFEEIFSLDAIQKMSRHVNFFYHQKNIKNAIKQVAVRSVNVNMKMAFCISYILFGLISL